MKNLWSESAHTRSSASFLDTFYENHPRCSSESETKGKTKPIRRERERRKICILKSQISVKTCPLSIVQQSQKEKIEKYDNQRERTCVRERKGKQKKNEERE
jgi:hypothetical protein